MVLPASRIRLTWSSGFLLSVSLASEARRGAPRASAMRGAWPRLSTSATGTRGGRARPPRRCRRGSPLPSDRPRAGQQSPRRCAACGSRRRISRPAATGAGVVEVHRQESEIVRVSELSFGDTKPLHEGGTTGVVPRHPACLRAASRRLANDGHARSGTHRVNGVHALLSQRVVGGIVYQLIMDERERIKCTVLRSSHDPYATCFSAS